MRYFKLKTYMYRPHKICLVVHCVKLLYTQRWSLILSVEIKRALLLFKDIPLRTRRALSLFKDILLKPEGRYHHRHCTVTVPFWFSIEHPWILIAPFWLSKFDNILSNKKDTVASLKLKLRLIDYLWTLFIWISFYFYGMGINVNVTF